ncbi:MAG: deoxyribonuclease, partial [Pseudonocardiales bacterium]|nr:deoxyribonuclease [Pseudonocardiales bacterium]
LLIEPTAGGGGALASDATSLGAYLDVLGRDERIGVCLDTCHMHAAGHDLSTGAGFAAALRTYGRAAGRGRIGLVHVNDSRDPAGSRRDRHASIGTGTIGPDAFRALFTSTATRGVPLVVETAEADHAADIATLKALRDAPDVRG